MSDRNNKNPKPKLKPLSNSLRLKSPHSVRSRQNVSNILSRLPFLRKLNETQNQLISITLTWQKWCADQANPIINEFASPTIFDGEILTISCTQSSTATLLKHQQSSLLEALHKAGFEQIKSLRLQMTLTQKSSATESADDSSHQQDLKTKQTNTPSVASEEKWPKPSASSVKSIETVQTLIKNEQLAESLKRLAETLKKAT
ncbi:MAG: hypothetical protein ACJAQ6_001120 [Arenicella sp.]|jgi:hypothetical protein